MSDSSGILKAAAALVSLVYIACPLRVAAQARFIHAYSGTSSAQLAIWAAKDLGLFAKYGLDADLVFISGSARAMQALLGGSIQAADSDGIGPINAIQRGGDAVIVAGLINKSFFKFVAQKEITTPAQLRNKRIGVANFGGSNEFAVLLALKEWNIPKEAVTLVAAGGSAVRLAALEKKGLDATVLPYDHALAASRMGMKVLADIPELVPTFPDKVITMRRSYLGRERDSVKKYLQALTEGTYLVNTNREISAGILRKRLGLQDNKVIEENLNIYTGVFSLPARVGRAGLSVVLEQMRQQAAVPKVTMRSSGTLTRAPLTNWSVKVFLKNFRSKKFVNSESCDE
jgi:ABC-type nitrate/sulfonate/bicarbonate transport system substrate-binding protein